MKGWADQSLGLRLEAEVSEVFEGFDSLGQVAVELGHAGGEERVDHGARQEAAQVCLEETEHLGFVGLSADKREEK